MPFRLKAYLRSDSGPQLRRQVIVLAVLAGIGVLGIGVWALRPLAPARPLPSDDSVVGKDAAIAVLRPAPVAWPKSLWMPLQDQAVEGEAAKPLRAQLFSIVQQGGASIAVLDFQDGKDLVYAREGETVQGLLLEKIDATGVMLKQNGHSQRVELAR